MKLLIVGLGSMGKRRARLAAGLGHTLAGVDAAPERRSEAETMLAEVYPSIDEALAGGHYDAAFVCTAPLSHHGIIRQLLLAGLPVFTELNLVADGYDELMQLAAQKGQTLFLSNTMLYRAEIQYIQKKVAEFAKPVNYTYHIGQYLPDWHPWESYKNFFVGDKRTGGVREIFGIELPWLLSTFGEAAPLSAAQDILSGLELPYADSVFTLLRHAGGAKGMLAVDVVSPKAVRNLEIFGEGLHLFWEGNPNSLYDFDPATGEKRRINVYQNAEQDPRYSDNIVENAYLDEMLNFFDVLAGRAVPRWSFEKDLAALRLIDAIEAAAMQE